VNGPLAPKRVTALAATVVATASAAVGIVDATGAPAAAVAGTVGVLAVGTAAIAGAIRGKAQEVRR
jgi:hypothetical protein